MRSKLSQFVSFCQLGIEGKASAVSAPSDAGRKHFSMSGKIETKASFGWAAAGTHKRRRRKVHNAIDADREREDLARADRTGVGM